MDKKVELLFFIFRLSDKLLHAARAVAGTITIVSSTIMLGDVKFVLMVQF